MMKCVFSHSKLQEMMELKVLKHKQQIKEQPFLQPAKSKWNGQVNTQVVQPLPYCSLKPSAAGVNRCLLLWLVSGTLQ